MTSGTRIGEALKAAVAAHDKRFPGYQDIVLISDGDDPADDREWVRGADEARKAEIPVHTVGVGNPDEDYILAFGEELVADAASQRSRFNRSPPRRAAGTSPPAETAAARRVLPLAPGTIAEPGRQRRGDAAAEGTLPVVSRARRWRCS